jgi:drug/metabolite transporter (DMT)-like permease
VASTDEHDRLTDPASDSTGAPCGTILRVSSARPSATPALAYVSWAAICLIWGTTYLAIRISLETLPPALSAGLRWLAGGAVLAGLIVARGGRLPARSAWPGLVLIGLLFIVLGNGLVVWAEQWVPSGLAAVLLATSPFWMVGIEATLCDGERPHGRTWAGLAMGFVGIVLLVWPDLTAAGDVGSTFLWGVLGLQAACLAWSIGSSVERRRHVDEHTLGGAALEMIFGGLVLAAIGTAAGEWPRVAFTARSGLAFGYLVVFGSIVAYSAYIHTLKHLPISTISLSSYINPIIAVVLGALVANEAFGPRSLAASAFVLLGVAVVGPGGGGARRAEPDGAPGPAVPPPAIASQEDGART